MATFKDKEVVAEALGGETSERPRVKLKKGWLVVLGMTAVGLAVAAVVKLHPTHLPTVARAVEAAPERGQQPAKALAAKPAPETATKTAAPQVIVLPPVVLAVKADTAKAAPKTALAPALSSSLFAKSRADLRSGAYADALTHLKEARPAAKADSELKEAVVLEARALLAQGKIDEARKKFEPLAFSTAETETGADALLGNFWCQAGSLSKCRDSELDSVLKGAPSWGGAMAALEEARRLEEKAGDDVPSLERARALYQQALDTNKLDQPTEKDCVARLEDLTDRVVLNPRVACTAPKAVFYKVEAGDVLEKICKRYKVNIGQPKRINHLNDKLIVRLGQVLKLLPGDVVYKVDRTRLLGTLYIDGVFIRRYPIGIGPGDATPVGAYTVERKVVNPDWYYDGKRIPFGDPENILGTRWMAMVPTDSASPAEGLGVHGTALPDSVPGRESKGCVRMHNGDVEELYDFMPQGGRVEIFN